jgi:hypothetical protein
MHGPVLLACGMCVVQSVPILCLSFIVGGVWVSHRLLKPFVIHVSARWGWPQWNAPRCISLISLLAWSGVWAWIGARSHGPCFVAICVSGLVLCSVYLWIRGCWLLQQCRIEAWLPQFLFLSVLGPGMLIVGVILGQAVVGGLLLGIIWPAVAIPWFVGYAGVGAVFMAMLFGCLRYVLSARLAESSEVVSSESAGPA